MERHSWWSKEGSLVIHRRRCSTKIAHYNKKSKEISHYYCQNNYSPKKNTNSVLFLACSPKLGRGLSRTENRRRKSLDQRPMRYYWLNHAKTWVLPCKKHSYTSTQTSVTMQASKKHAKVSLYLVSPNRKYSCNGGAAWNV